MWGQNKVTCPQVIADYYKYMGGVDHFDHLQSNYNVVKKSRKLWIKIFYYLLDSVIVNSYILYQFECKNQRSKAMKQLSFRRKLANELVGNFSSGKKSSQGCSKGKKLSGRNVNDLEMSEVGLHLPIPKLVDIAPDVPQKKKKTKDAALNKKGARLHYVLIVLRLFTKNKLKQYIGLFSKKIVLSSLYSTL